MRVSGTVERLEWWCIDADGFRRVQTAGSNGSQTRVTIPELLWSALDQRPSDAWERKDNEERRWKYRIQGHLAHASAGGRSFADCLVVVATLGNQTKRTYYRRGVGEVMPAPPRQPRMTARSSARGRPAIASRLEPRSRRPGTRC